LLVLLFDQLFWFILLQVGYCQGMNFVAGLLLQYLPEAEAFGALVVLMTDRGLRKYYSTDMELLQVREGHSLRRVEV
jgi:hypothetical protein